MTWVDSDVQQGYCWKPSPGGGVLNWLRHSAYRLDGLRITMRSCQRPQIPFPTFQACGGPTSYPKAVMSEKSSERAKERRVKSEGATVGRHKSWEGLQVKQSDIQAPLSDRTRSLCSLSTSKIGHFLRIVHANGEDRVAVKVAGFRRVASRAWRFRVTFLSRFPFRAAPPLPLVKLAELQSIQGLRMLLGGS